MVQDSYGLRRQKGQSLPKMRLGIIVTTDRHIEDVIGLARAAIKKGHEVIIFNTDTGTRLLGEPSFRELCKEPRIKMSFCDYNVQKLNISKEGIPEEILCGSQYNNAVLVHNSDRVIRL